MAEREREKNEIEQRKNNNNDDEHNNNNDKCVRKRSICWYKLKIADVWQLSFRCLFKTVYNTTQISFIYKYFVIIYTKKGDIFARLTERT